jgi:hypothetical protein
MRYQKVFSGTIAPHMAFNPSSQVSMDFCSICTTLSCVEPEEAVCMRSVSSMKEYPMKLPTGFQDG